MKQHLMLHIKQCIFLKVKMHIIYIDVLCREVRSVVDPKPQVVISHFLIFS